ncbi:alpha/beta fold hydrolase [Amycolatopsis sp. 195334CR]|uniref:alpha/beta fold hydrolase n=1 Tax=Amycolatopsis sp. 195334CR TaxID=2814588 RepID=UPI001A906AC0|nr:alpha/beta hydrolase [Amycolatopsis sp. 195334CR]MBN6033788.1 alpha/beta hydrolase [Amycolatopsis sp. 195334CR]
MGVLETGDGHLVYDVRGDGPPLVLLHPGGASRAIWDEFAPGHRVVRFDARGHGESSEPDGPFSHHNDLRLLLDALGIDRVPLVGSSLGSRTAIDFALAHPDRVDRLFLASPGISGMVERDPFTVEQYRKVGEALAAQDFPLAYEHVVRLLVDGPHRTPEQVDPAVRARFHALLVENAQQGHGRFPPGDELDGVNRVGELHARTLVLTGSLDTSDIHEMADLLERSGRDVRRVSFDGAGHQVALERPREFGDLLTEFLRDH